MKDPLSTDLRLSDWERFPVRGGDILVPPKPKPWGVDTHEIVERAIARSKARGKWR